MKLKELFESPTIIPDLDDPDELDLFDKTKNQLLYKHFISKKYQYKKKLFDLTENASVYQFKTQFFCLDTELEKVTYFMSYGVNNNKKLGQFVWQSMVWTDLKVHSRYLVGVASKVFFEYLLPKFHVILTDSQQTWKGRRFWEISIGAALDKKLNVYFFDFLNNNLIELQNFDDLYDYQKKYDIWGLTKSHEMRRMVISDKKLL